MYFSVPKRHTFILMYTHIRILSADAGQHQANGPGRLSLWTIRPTALGQPRGPLGYVGREKGRREREREGGASTHGGFRKSVRDTQTRARETDSGRRRHRLSISCLWTLSAVCYRLSVSLFTYPLTSTAQAPSLCPCQFNDKNPAATVTYGQSYKHEKWGQKLWTENMIGRDLLATASLHTFLFYRYIPF